ncbi:hypothetical protein KKG65_02950 [Patescibacteria group bacterium]|nr:hypothetical protein [Patescibacteria group bacterium]
MDNQQAVPSFSSNVARAQEIYDGLDKDFINKNKDKYLSVEPESGLYFIGDSREEAVEKANKKLPNIVVFTRRIGSFEKVAMHSSLQYSSPNNYARLF